MTGSPAAFTADGYTYSEDDVALLLDRLALLPMLSGVTLGSTTQAQIGRSSLVQFQVSATIVKPTGGPTKAPAT